MPLRNLMLGMFAFGMASPVLAQTVSYPTDERSVDPQALPNPAFKFGYNYPRGFAINRAYLQQLTRLRNHYLQVRANDGGQLTSTHRMEMQDKLDAINENWRRNLRNIDPMSPDRPDDLWTKQRQD